MRLLVFGNSQVVALTHSWPTLRAAYPGTEVSFLPLAYFRADCLVDTEGRLTSHSAQVARITERRIGTPDVDPADYDAIALVGLNYKLEFPIAAQGIGQPLYGHLVFAHFRQSLACYMLRRFRRITDVPITLTPTPFTAREPMPSNVPLNPALCYARIERMLAVDRAIFVRQPAETLATEIFTKPEYATDAPCEPYRDGRPFTFHPPDDLSHMNASYGALVMRDILVALGCRPVG